MEHSKELVGKRLKMIRNDKELNQTELADASDLSLEAITRYEKGKNGMSLEKAIKVADALGVTLDELACRADYTCKA